MNKKFKELVYGLSFGIGLALSLAKKDWEIKGNRRWPWKFLP